MIRRSNFGLVTVLLSVALVTGCSSSADPQTGAASTASSPGSDPTDGLTESRVPDPAAPTLDATASSIPSACQPLPHEAPDVEKLMPTSLAGRPLKIWSVHGEGFITCIQGGSAADIDAFEAGLAAEGLGLDDFSVAIAGRADAETDPPYFIVAYQLAGHPGSEFPPTVGVDYPDEAAFREGEIAGKQVLIGETAGLDQSEHVRGRPYVWDSPTTHYLIVADDEAWVAEALQSLN